MTTTIEPNPQQAMYGSSRHHIQAWLQDLPRHSKAGTWDHIIINGVIGWGLDDEKQIELAVKVMHRALKPGGLVIVGYNIGLATCCHQFEPRFQKVGLGTIPHLVDLAGSEMHHVYAFFEKPERSASS